MKRIAIVLASMALVIAGCSDKDDSGTGADSTAGSDSAVVVEDVEVITEPAATGDAGDAPVIEEEVIEEINIEHAGQKEEELNTQE